MKVAKVNFSDSIGAGEWFWGTTLNDVRYAVEGYSAFEASGTPSYPETVELHFWNCYGGEVTEGYAIYNYLRDLAKKGVAVKSYIHGLCASIASVVVLAGDERIMDAASLLMVHKPMVDAGPCANADDHQQAILVLNTIQAQIAGVYVSRTGMDLAAAHLLMNEESWMDADTCLANGFATSLNTESLVSLVAPAGAEKVINYFKPPLKPQNSMPINPADEDRLVDKIINAAKNIFAPKNEAPEATATNLAVTLAGDGGSIYVDTTADDIATGDLVYTDEAMTVMAADGSYSLADGRTITVAAGAIESIATAEDTAAAQNTATELETAKARVAELEGQLATANAEKETAVNSAGELTKTVTNLQAKLKAVPGTQGNPNQPGIQATPAKNSATPAAPSARVSFAPPARQ